MSKFNWTYKRECPFNPQMKLVKNVGVSGLSLCYEITPSGIRCCPLFIVTSDDISNFDGHCSLRKDYTGTLLK